MRGPVHLIAACIWAAPFAAALAADTDIRARRVSVPASLQVGDAVSITLDQYWRGNLRLQDNTLTDNKTAFPHVPNLVEYRIDLPVGGEFEVQARYTSVVECPVRLTLDGEPLATVCEHPTADGAEWISLARSAVCAGDHRLRFTSRYVETPFPTLRELRLVYRGGPAPLPMKPPPVTDHQEPLSKDWYKAISRKIHGDFHTAGFIRGVGKDFNADEYAETLVRSGVNAICIFAKGHHGYAYYNTRIGTRHPGLDFDLMAAQIEACHRRNLHVWTYFSIAPDELYTSTQEQVVGNPETRPTRIEVDLNSHYVTDYLWPMIEECVRDYAIDGLFFDYPGNEAFVSATVKRIKQIKPGVVVAYNHQWAKSRADLRQLDVLEIESWRHMMTLYHWQYFARYARGAVPLTAMTISFWKSWGDFGGLADEAMLRYQVATALANGCSITIGDHLHPYGRLDPARYERIGRVLQKAIKIEPYVIDAQSIAYVALWRPQEVPLMGADTPCHALIDAGIHFTVIDAQEDPAPFAAVVVPDGSKVDAAYVARLTRYVEAGGRLLVMGQPTAELAALLGVHVQAESEPAYIRIEPRTLPTPPATDLYTYMPVTPAEPADGTATLAPLVWPMGHGTIHRSRRQSPPQQETSGYAAITWRKHGQGQVVYSAAPLLEIYGQWGYTAMRQVLADLLNYMIPPAERLLQVEAPAPLEVSLNRQGQRVIVHLVHCPQSRHTASSWEKDDLVNQEPAIDGLPTIAGARLHLAETLIKGRKAFCAATDQPLTPIGTQAGVTTLQVPDFQISAVLVFE